MDLAHAQDRLDWLTNYNEDTRKMFEAQLDHLITEAKRRGVNLAIDTVPTRPLGMGRHMTIGRAYLARSAYQEQMALEARVQEFRDANS